MDATWREQPHAAWDVQEQQRRQIYVVRRPNHDEICVVILVIL
jgi:hypothetical protein